MAVSLTNLASDAQIPEPLWDNSKLPAPKVVDVLTQTAHFLSKIGCSKTLAALIKEGKKFGFDLDVAEWEQAIEDGRAQPLLQLLSVYRTANGKYPTTAPPKIDEDSDDSSSESSDSSDSDDSSSESSDSSDSDDSDDEERDPVEGVLVDVEAEETSDDSSDEDSEAESETPSSDSSAKVGEKRKRILTPSSSEASSAEDSDSSSDASEARPSKKVKVRKASNDSDSDSDSSSDDSEAPPAAKVKTQQTKGDKDSDSDSDSDSSDSDDDSSSDSDSSPDEASQKPPPPPPAKKNKAKPKPKAITEVKKEDTSSGSSVTLENDDGTHMHPDRLSRMPSSAPVSASKTNKNIKKEPAVPFSRIPVNQAVDPRFSSNQYVSYDYADRAHQDLIVTKGKGFTKEKNKKKRGSYRGGLIDLAPKGIKFED